MVRLQGLPRGYLQEVALRAFVFLAGAALGLLALYTHYLSGYALVPFALYRLLQDAKEKAWRALLPFAPYLLYLLWAHLSRPYWPVWDVVTQARIAERFAEKGVPFVLDRRGERHAAMLAFVAPGLKDRQEVLTAGELWRYCGDPRPLLAYRSQFLSPEGSPVQRLILCRGPWREVHGTNALTLFLLPPPRR